MIALITGMTGFVGQHLANLLRKKGFEVYDLELDGKWIDLREMELVEKSIKEIKPDRAYHLAAMSSVSQSLKDPDTTFSVNVDGTKNLLNALLDIVPKARVLAISSGDVYGEYEGEQSRIFKENDELAPANPYAKSKVLAEEVCIDHFKNKGQDIRMARPLGHTGPGQMKGFVVPDLASQAAAIALGKQGPEIKVGRLDVSREFADVRDVVRAYWTIMETGAPGEVYNLATNDPHTIEEVGNTLIELADIDAKLVSANKKIRAKDGSTAALDMSKMKALGFEYETSFRQTLSDVLEYWKNEIGKNP